MKNPKLPFLLSAALLLALSACNLGATPPDQVSEEDQLATMVSGTLEAQAQSPATEAAPTSLLPHSLYFLTDTGEGEGFQVWRLETDGLTQTQITREAAEVTDYTVNPVDGRVAYVSSNQLLVINHDGSGRTLLVEGQPDDGSDSFYYQRRIHGLAWSHDGFNLVYGLNGINLYDFVNNGNHHFLDNQVETLEGGALLPRALYFPSQWSPDGSRFLVEVGWMEGGTLAVYHLLSGQFVEFIGSGIVCCQPTWSPDSATVLVGSPYFGMISSGLWRYDSLTGQEMVLIPTTSPDNTLNMVGWPLQLPSGEIQYFYTNLAAIPEDDSPLTFVRAANDGIGGRAPVRPESWQVVEALWNTDGTQVVIVQPLLGEPQYPLRGPVVLVDTAGSPAHPLLPSAREIQWGP